MRDAAQFNTTNPSTISTARAAGQTPVIFDAVLHMMDGDPLAFFFTTMCTAGGNMICQTPKGERSVPIADVRQIDIEIMAGCL